jgi:hypothetical protein
MVGQASSDNLGEKMRLVAEARIGAVRRSAMRCCVVATALAASVAGGVSAQAPSAGDPAPGREPASIRITPENARFNNYLRELAGPRALVGVVGGGVLGQLRQHDGMDLGERLAERATQHTAEVSVRHGLAAVMHRSTDYHYQFCECHGFGPRVAHALVESFTDRRADGTTPGTSPASPGSTIAAWGASRLVPRCPWASRRSSTSAAS